MQLLNWVCKPFDLLNASELYAIIQLRNEVFVVEQNCVFQDADHKDRYCYHLSGFINNKLVAYARLVPAGISYPIISIGRVVTSPAYRREGFGKILMLKAIEVCYDLYGKQQIKIGAQLYLKGFYQSLGFEQTSEMYLEDNIPHIEMTKL